MRLNQMIRYMKQFPGKIGSNVYASVSDLSNPQNVTFLRQMQKEMSIKEYLEVPLQDLRVVVFDLETTGFSPDSGDKILSIGAVKVIGEEVMENEQFYSLVRTDAIPSPEIAQLTGITRKDIETAPDISEVLIQFFEFIKKHNLVAHHAKHEQVFMQRAIWDLMKSRFKHRIIDTSFLTDVVDPGLGLVKLEDWCEHCQIDSTNRHNALGDALMTAKLWARYMQETRKKGFKTLRDVYEKLAQMR